MSDSGRRDTEASDVLPAAVDERIMAILELPEDEREAAFAALFAGAPEHEPTARRRLERAGLLRARIDTSLAGLAEGHPASIGPYRILDVLGEGGMGVVYRAEQREPLQRQVALKVIKAGMDTREILNRFERERQALARMEFPGIAQVYDAGEENASRRCVACRVAWPERIDTR